MIPVDHGLYRRVQPVKVAAVSCPDANEALSLLLSWYWRCRDGGGVILNGIPQWEADLLHAIGVLGRPVTYGIQTARRDALPSLVQVADEISVALTGSEVRGAASISAKGIEYFMDREPSWAGGV
jgi:hypothetical protein